MERNTARAFRAVRRLLDALLIGLIFVVLAGVVLGKLVPLTGRQTIIIGGRSMEPAVPLGAAVVDGPVDPATLAAGQIVSLKAGPQNTLYTHRIVAVVDRPDGRWVRTKGDANADEDPTLVPASAIVGRTELVLPLAGYLIALLSIPAGVLFLIALAATLMGRRLAARVARVRGRRSPPLDTRRERRLGPRRTDRRPPQPVAARDCEPGQPGATPGTSSNRCRADRRFPGDASPAEPLAVDRTRRSPAGLIGPRHGASFPDRVTPSAHRRGHDRRLDLDGGGSAADHPRPSDRHR
jgi:signal peptidase I